jgi:hypothetical protein
MSQAVGNQSLAIKQKLSVSYQQRLEILSNRIDDLWSARISVIEDETAVQHQPIEIFDRLTGRDNRTDDPNICNAVIIYDRMGKLVYPVTEDDDYPSEFPPEFNLAWTTEFTDENFTHAIQLYEQFIDSVDDSYYLRYSALLGQIRCLRKSGEFDQAVTLCREMAYGQIPEDISVSSVALIAKARILLINLKSQTKEGIGRSDLENLIGSAINYTPGSGSGFLLMPSGTRIFLLRKALEIIQKSKWAQELNAQVLRAKELLSAEELSAAAIERYDTGTASEPLSEKYADELESLLSATLETIESVELTGLTEQLSEEAKQQISKVLDAYQARKVGAGPFSRPAFATFESWSEDSLRRLELPEDAFGVYHNSGGKTYLLLKKAKEFILDFDLSGADFEELGVSYRITDSFGRYACGLKNPEKAAFLTAPLGKYFPSWNVEIHFKDIDIFETTADKQRVVYLWTGLLAIAVMFAAGLLATRVVGKQIRTNKLKNDFIATVSHELKTPLASMRVLVDTLLEGSYRNQQQVTEYLQLVSKENERLTGLIDNCKLPNICSLFQRKMKDLLD